MSHFHAVVWLDHSEAHVLHFTAEDVDFSFDLALNPAKNMTAVYGAPLQSAVGADEVMAGTTDHISGVNVIDDNTISITFKQPNALFPDSISELFILPKHKLEGMDLATMKENPYWADAQVGTGPFVWSKYTPGESIELKANPKRSASGTVLEAKLDKGRGPVATVLVRNGTLKVGDYFICGSVFGRVRAMFDGYGVAVREAGPSMPVELTGLESLPEVGDTLQAVTDTAKAKQIVLYRENKARELAMSKTNRITLDQLHDHLKEGEIKDLNIVIKTDVGGTAEVLTDTLQKLSNDKVRIRVIHSGVGAITETDVLLASASEAIIVGFNVRPERTAQATAEQEKVDIRLHTIIYELSDEIKRAMTGMLEPVFKEVYKGRAQVREAFGRQVGVTVSVGLALSHRIDVHRISGSHG